MEQTLEVQEVSLEKVIETKLVQANVTSQVLAALKEKYGNMTLKGLEDKESYLELKSAAKECAKVRTLTVKLCKEGRERAVKEQKLWIAKEKEIVSEVAVVEDALDAEIKKFDDEVDRKVREEKERQEEAYINRQAELTKMGVTYQSGSFVLGEASFEAELVKGASQDIWEEAVVPKFRVEYEKIEALRVQQEKERTEREIAMKAEQDKLRQEQEAFRLQQEEFKKKQDDDARIKREADQEAENKERSRILELVNTRSQVLRGLGMGYDGSQYDFADIYIHKNSLSSLPEKDWTELVSKTTVEIKSWKDADAKRQEEKRISDLEAAKQEAIKKEQERAEALRQQQELERIEQERIKKEQMEQAGDKVKYNDLIQKIQAIKLPEMRSGQYRKKVAAIRLRIDEILAL